MTIIVIGDSHIVPLKIEFDKLAETASNFAGEVLFIPHHWIRGAKSFCLDTGTITLFKSAKEKTRAHYSVANLASETNSDTLEELQVSMKNSVIFLVGLGLGGDGLLRAFSESGTLNESNVSRLPIVPPFEDYACLADSHPFYTSELMLDVLKGYLMKTPAYGYYSMFSSVFERYSLSLYICSIPVISKNAVSHFTGLPEQHLNCYSRVFEIWNQIISLSFPGAQLLQSTDLLDLSHFEDSYFLKSEHRFDVKPYGVHVSSKTCLPLAKIIATVSV